MNKFDLIKVIVVSLVLATLIYPGFERLYLYKQTNELEDLVMAPLEFLGKDQIILSNNDKYTRYGTNYKELDLLRERDLFIGIKNEFLFHEKWVNLSEERNRIKRERWDDLINLRTKLSNNEYSVIIYGPATVELDLYSLIRGENLDNHCEIFLLSEEHKCTLCKYTTRIFFRENEICDNIMSDILDYYADNFYRICRFDELAANFKIRGTMAY